MNNAISNNPNYDMPDDSFFNFYFLIHKNRIFTTKIALKVGEITTALLNMKAEDMKKIYDLTVSFAGFADNNMAMKNEQTMTEFVDRIIEIEQIAVTLPPYRYVGYAMAVALRYVPMRDDAEDVVQDSFIKVFSTGTGCWFN